jgi:hypothetical protein
MHSNVHQSVIVSDLLWISESFLSLALLLLFRVRKIQGYFWLRAFLWLKCLSFPVLFTLIRVHPLGHTHRQQYAYYFYSYWTVYAMEAIVCFFVLRELFTISLEPLEGLRKLGMVLFRWVVCISAVVALAVSVAPSGSGKNFVVLAVSQFQMLQSVLQLCLLVFLITVAKPLGVTLRHRVFGASMGFSLLAMSDLLSAGWFHSPTMYSTMNLFHASALTLTVMIWMAYVFMPEPKRIPVALPVTSALLRWNEVAKSLGKSGGHVVVVGQQEIIQHDMAHWERAVEVVRAKHPVNAA